MPTTQICRYGGVISKTGLLNWTMTPAQLASLGLTSADNMRFTSPKGGTYVISGSVTPAHVGWKPNKSTYSVVIGGPVACPSNSSTAYWAMIEEFNEQNFNPGGDVVVAPNETFYVAVYVRGYTPPDDNPNLPAIISGQLKVTKIS